MKRPAYQWYPGDFRRDMGLQACSWEARSLWRDLLDIMHDGQPYGHLSVNGNAIPPDRVAAMIGLSLPRVRRYLAELEAAGVSSRTEGGVLYSRRMVRDEEARNRSRHVGDLSTRLTGRETGKRPGIPGKLFRFMLEKWGGCLNCGTTVGLEVHRIVPGRHGGRYEPGNVVLLCAPDHKAIDYGELTLDDILTKRGIDTVEGICEGIDLIPQPIPDTIPSAVAVASAVARPSTKNGSHPKKKRTADAAVGPPDWVNQAVEVYATLGHVEHGPAGRMLKPLVARRGWPEVRLALECFCKLAPYQDYLTRVESNTLRPGEEKVKKIGYNTKLSAFVEQYAHWAEQAGVTA